MNDGQDSRIKRKKIDRIAGLENPLLDPLFSTNDRRKQPKFV